MTSTRAALPRRRFLGLSAAGTLAALGDLGFLGHLPPVASAEANVDPARVRLRPEIEPLVRLLEDTPRERVLEEVAARIRRGLAYPDLLAALLLAGVRNIQPRPVGFKFHAVLVVNSAHLASLASPATDRWLPLLWAVDQFKSSQAADERAGDWTLGPVDEAVVPAADKARAAFVAAMDRWDEPAADAAIAGLARTAPPSEIFEVLARYGARDFREIGHKAIYVANSFRTLDVVGWQHAEPVLRSLAYALLDKDGDSGNPSTSDLPADRPYRLNQQSATRLRAGWSDGRASADGAREMLHALRQATPEAASTLAIDLLNRSVAPQSIFEACFESSAELMMRSPGFSRCTRPRSPTRWATRGSAAATTGRAGCSSCRTRRSCRCSAAGPSSASQSTRSSRCRPARRVPPQSRRSSPRSRVSAGSRPERSSAFWRPAATCGRWPTQSAA